MATVSGVMGWLDELDADAELWVITAGQEGAEKRRITGGIVAAETTNGQEIVIALATEPYFEVPDEFC